MSAGHLDTDPITDNEFRADPQALRSPPVESHRLQEETPREARAGLIHRSWRHPASEKPGSFLSRSRPGTDRKAMRSRPDCDAARMPESIDEQQDSRLYPSQPGKA